METKKFMAMRKRSPVAFLVALTVLAGLPAMLFSAAPAAAGNCSSTPSPNLDWSECTKKNLMLEGSNFESADLSGADLSLTDLSGSNVKSANFEKASLVRASLADATADGVNFAKIEAYRSNFAGIVAPNATFAGAELQRANFEGAQLKGVGFEKSELGRVNFSKAILTGAHFTLANLSRADLSGAELTGPVAFDRAFMFLTRIEGLDMSAATGLEQAQIDLACGDENTKLPNGLTKPKSWPCAAAD